MGRFRVAVVACACLLLAACGGTAKQTSIRRPVALRLASESDAVAAELRLGNACLALRRARVLRRQVGAAIAAGSIPPPLAVDARRASARIVAGISCTSPAPPPTSPSAPPPPAAPSCADLDARKQALEAEKRTLGKREKGKAAQARKKEIDQEEHALDQQRKGCK
jgi:hypothetical protein